MSVVEPVTALGPYQRVEELQGVADRQPVHGFIDRRGLIQLIFLASGKQPGTDVLRQHHDGFVVKQALVTGLLQVGRQLAVQMFEALIIGGEQLRLDTQQVAALAGLAVIHCQLNAQIRKIMAYGALPGPNGVTGDHGDQQQGNGDIENFAHGRHREQP